MLWKIKMLLKLAVVKFGQTFPFMLSDEAYSACLYFIVFGKRLDIKHPKTFNEHIIQKKLEEKKYGYSQYTDKYAVRDYVKERVGSGILNEVYGVYSSFDEIDFDNLPDSFALKATHASGFNIIVPDKSKLDRKKARKKFNKWLKTNFYYKDREKNYKYIPPRIMCDKYIHFGEVLVEYKIYCFNGKAKIICQNIEKGNRRFTNVYDENFALMPVRFGYEPLEYPLTQHKEKLLEIAEQLACGFDFVRVDLYENEGVVLFSELTFHSGGGLVPFEPDLYDAEFGIFFKE